MGRKARLKRARRQVSKDAPVSLVEAPRGLPKVSGALTELAQPFVDELGIEAELEEVKAVFDLVAAAWNTGSLMSTTGGTDAPESIRASLDSETCALFDEVLDRRQRFYSDDLRVVTHFQVSREIDGGFHLIAASVLPEATTRLPGSSHG